MTTVAEKSEYLLSTLISYDNISGFRLIVLECVDPVKNHSKRYVMERMSPDAKTWTVYYGRIGLEPKRSEYGWDSINGSSSVEKDMWKKYNEKIKKGYRLVSVQRFGDQLYGSVPAFYHVD